MRPREDATVVFRELRLVPGFLTAVFLAVALVAVPVTPVATVALASVTSGHITAGEAHTCALTNAGGVKCWGVGGMLGNGSVAPSSKPVDVTGLASGVTAIAAGDNHTCALTSAGGVKCWGFNGFGELGDGSTNPGRTPVDVVGLANGVLAIAARARYTCAITVGGGVKCWGSNQFGRLGDGSTSDRHSPVDVVGLASGVTAIAAGFGHTCVLTSTGGVKCWGRNSSGQLGNGTRTDSSKLVNVTGLTSGVRLIAAGANHTCAVVSGGGAKCWGSETLGQLGVASRVADVTTPVSVVGLASGVLALTAGNGHTCALTSGGAAKCWGYNASGQLGNASTTDSLTAVDVAGLADGVSAIVAGFHHTCALMSSGGVKCWGSGTSGQLGNGATANSDIPVDVLFSGVPSNGGQQPGVTGAWQAKVGASGINGTVNLSTVTNGVGSIGLKLTKLKASSTLPVVLYRGTCTPIGAVLFTLASIKTSSAGAASRTSSLSPAQVTAILAATSGAGKIAIRIGSGALTTCAALTKRAVSGPQAVVQAFYNWYIAQIGVAKLHGRPDLTPAFVYYAEHFNDGQVIGGADPILCAQAVPDSVKASPASISRSSATVKITEVFGENQPPIPVKLTLAPVGWQISAVLCNG